MTFAELLASYLPMTSTGLPASYLLITSTGLPASYLPMTSTGLPVSYLPMTSAGPLNSYLPMTSAGPPAPYLPMTSAFIPRSTTEYCANLQTFSKRKTLCFPKMLCRRILPLQNIFFAETPFFPKYLPLKNVFPPGTSSPSEHKNTLSRPSLPEKRVSLSIFYSYQNTHIIVIPMGE